MKVFKFVIIYSVVCGLLIGGIIWAASVFPTSLDNLPTVSPGDIIQSSAWNNIVGAINNLEEKVGIDNSNDPDSLDYLVKNTNSKLGKIASISTSTGLMLVTDGTNWATTSESSYVLTNGSRAFTGTVGGVMPTSSSHLATKEYVDLGVDVVLDYFLASSTDAGTGYLNMFDYDLDGTEQSIASSSLPASTDDQLLFTWISTTTLTKVLSSGVYTLHVHAEETGSNNNVQIYFTLATTSGAVIMTSEVSDTITDRRSVEIHAALSSEVTLASTDRLVLMVYANVGSGSTGELTIYYEGNTASRLSVPTTAGVFSDIFLRQDGTKSLTGDWDVGGFDITGITSLNATSLTAVGLTLSGLDTGFLKVDGSGNVSTSTIDISDDTNLVAGRSLTLSGDSVEADSELYVYKAKIAFEDPTADDDFFFEELNKAVTFTSIYCKTLVGTVDLDVQIAGSDINGTDITCNTTGVLDDTLGGDTSGAVGEELKLAITSVASDPTYLMVQVNGIYDD